MTKMRSALISLAVIFSFAGDSFIVSAVSPPLIFSCKANEVYSNCDSHPCQNTCAEPNRISRCTYTPACYPGCICKPGFVRNQQGECALVNTCGPNEVPALCKDFYPPTCASITSTGLPPPAMVQPECQLGCNCAEGYVRDHNNVCVAANQCQCPDPNAIIVSCPNQCPGGTCQSPDFAPCASPFKMYGCQCKTGYVKDTNGKCILLSQCPDVCPSPYETQTLCVDACPATCDSITSGTPPNCGLSTPPRVGCSCIPGYVRSVYGGSCVPATSCVCSKANAIVVANPNPCPGGSCVSPLFAQCADSRQLFGCQCKDGYVKDLLDNCIPYSQCPLKCTGRNEIPALCPCLVTCDSIQSVSSQLPCVPSTPCVPGCDCLPGYVRDLSTRTCVPATSCPCTTANAIVVANPNPCSGGDCVSPLFAQCDALRPSFGCQCKDGYVKQGSACIPYSKCPLKCTGRYEIPALCPCLVTCDSIQSVSSQLPCVPSTPCVPGCDCIPGYVRNISTKTCVPATSCICTDVNAIVVANPNPCSGGTCAFPSFDSCINPRPSFGCQCKDGFVKQNSVCIPYLLCPDACPRPYEIQTLCKKSCPSTCATITGITATSLCIPTTLCKAGCDCISGYVRNTPNGDCVPLTLCVAKCPGPYEKPALCVDPCPATCDSITSATSLSCRTLTPCGVGCDCIPGYVRNVDKVCVPATSCRCSTANAIVVANPNPCSGGTCALPSFDSCIIPRPSFGCQCKDGYVKDGSVCIPYSKCLGRCPGSFEIPALCKDACPATCDSIISGKLSSTCPSSTTCVLGCDCIPGYVREVPGGNCVSIISCAPKCPGPNEIPALCVDDCPENCDSITGSVSLSCPSPPKCGIGCDCIPGYIREYLGGDCVPITACGNELFSEINMLYKYHSTPKIWVDAIITCLQEGATLAMPLNAEEKAVLLTIFNRHPASSISGATNPEHLLLGFHDIFSEGEYMAIKGISINNYFRTWDGGQPDNYQNEDCGSLSRAGFINDFPCNAPGVFICQKEVSPGPTISDGCLPDDTAYIYAPHLRSAYKIHLNIKQWSEALKICESEGGYLAIINSVAEKDFLVKMFNEPSNAVLNGNYRDCALLGYHDQFKEGEFFTVEGNLLKSTGFAQWAAGNPNNAGGNENCVSMLSTGFLNDFPCDVPAAFFCEKSVAITNV